MIKDMSIDPRGKHVLLVEVIVDTGRTLAWLKNYLGTKGCASVRVACFLDKKARRTEKQVILCSEAVWFYQTIIALGAH